MNYSYDLNCLIYLLILMLLGIIIEYFNDLIDFKIFAKKYYDFDINIFRFSIILLKYKLKKHEL